MSCKYNNCKHCGYKLECEIYKENAELEDKLTKKVTLESLDVVSAKIKELEKENAELKKENQKWKDGIALKDEEIGCIETDFNTFKSEAKEIIKKLIEAIHIWDCKNLEEVEAEAEQFISEVEK